MEFEWNAAKAKRNLEKHGVSFAEAAMVFGSVLSLTFHDSDHSIGEERYITIGTSPRGRLLFVAHADRRERIRIISAREATRAERKSYGGQSGAR